jgi:hypothetical protein
MQKYDIIFLGKSSFTEDLHSHFHSHVNTIIIDNNCIPIDFSADFLPEITFIPSNKELEDAFGYIIFDNCRFELNPNINITKIFLKEIFKDIEDLNEKLIFEASSQINYLNELILDNFSKHPLNYFFRKLFKDTKSIFKIFKKIDIAETKFIKFVDTLCTFFAPGESNNWLYSKYLLYSLLSKKIYKFHPNEQPLKQIIEKESLKEIKLANNSYELIFDKQKFYGKILISTIPPHILNLANIKHPFINYKADEIFYNVSFCDNITIPTYLPEHMVLNDDKNLWLIKIKENKLNLYKKHQLNKEVEHKEIFCIVNKILPHIDKLPEYRIKPHIYIQNQRKEKKKLSLDKNYFFTKNIEYPYYGSDGEFIYRSIIKEALWKKLL